MAAQTPTEELRAAAARLHEMAADTDALVDGFDASCARAVGDALTRIAAVWTMRGEPEPPDLATDPFIAIARALMGTPEPETLDTLGLSARASNALHYDGIRTVEQLCALTLEDLMDIRLVGVATAREIKAALHKRGLSLAPSRCATCGRDGAA